MGTGKTALSVKVKVENFTVAEVIRPEVQSRVRDYFSLYLLNIHAIEKYFE
jgi:hypothetical protein